MSTRVSRMAATILVAVFVAQAALLAVDRKKAEYVGGTMIGMPEQTEGRLDTTDQSTLTFMPDKDGLAAIAIPYRKITSIEYGQKAGRRIAAAVLVSPLLLFTKKRKHFLTVSFNDANGKEQAAVLELGKDIIRTSLAMVETRSGKKIEYQDEEARKAGRGGH